MNDFLLFVSGPLPGPVLSATYDAWLAALSYFVAVLASYTAIDLAGRVREFHAEPRKAAAWLTGGAIAMGTGIWSMHFVAMLAYQLPIPVRYELWATLASMAVAIVSSGFALFIVTRHAHAHATTLPQLAFGGGVMGVGIGIMHYTGMAAMRLDALLMYYAGPFVLSVVAAMACATAALWLVGRRTETDRRSRILAALVMGVAVTGMHYTGMYATVCVSLNRNAAVVAGVNPALLAVALTAFTLLIMGIALVVSLQSELLSRTLRVQNILLRSEIAQKRQAERELQNHRDNLQLLVDTRTRDLSKANSDLLASEVRFRATFDQAPVGIMHTDMGSDRILLANPRLCEMLGYRQDELHKMTVADILHPDNANKDRGKYHGRMLRGEIASYSSERLYVRKDGSPLWVNRTVSLAIDAAGEPLYFIRVIEDISERKQAVQAQAQLAAIVESSNDAIVGRAPDDTIVSWNAAAERIFGWRADEALGKTFRSLLSVADGIRRGRFEEMLRGEPDSPPLEDNRRRKDGAIITVQSTLSPVRNEQGNILFISCIMRDVTEKIKAERRIEQLATRDALTGLPNRSTLIEQMDKAISRAARTKTQLAVMFVDLDRFKEVNDTLGHATGDELLRECARRLTDCVRELDIVARLGGDEFVVLLTDVTDTAIVSPIAERMLNLLTAPYQVLGRDAQTSASIGVCLYPSDGMDVVTLMKNADIAMYHAKELGRDNYQFYAEELNQRMIQRLQLERELRAAVENGEFVLHYQPQVAVATREIQGVEALVRWQHPIRGLLHPADFLPAAEETRLIVPLGEWILDHACSTMKAWRADGVAVPYIVVNVSAAQLSEELITAIRQALVNHDMAAGWLMLEITETMLMERVEEAISLLRRIRDMGIRIAMDDFGTGYSSLSVLQRLPLDMLKIDRSFVSAIDDAAGHARACAIIGAIVAIAKELNLGVVAEGVESTAQLAFLRTLECDAYQGYLHSTPMDAIRLQARVAAPAKSVLEDAQGRAITMVSNVTLALSGDER